MRHTPLADTSHLALAQDPVENLTRQYGAETQMARKHLDYLVNCLRSLDGIAEKLAEHGITVSADLGPVGNQAAAARRDLERESGRPTFTFPKPYPGTPAPR